MSDSYEKLIYENMDKGMQYRLTVSEFREQEYIHLRKYFLSYEGEWIPTKEGGSFPCTVQNVYQLLDGLIDIVSKSEALDGVVTHLQEKIQALTTRP